MLASPGLRYWLAFFLFAATAELNWAASPSQQASLPPGAVVMSRVVERATLVAQQTNATPCTYQKRSRVEELDASGKAVDTKERIYQVLQIQGLTFQRLVGIGGRNLSAAELREEDSKEKEFRKKLTARDPALMREQKESWITRDLVDRFEYKVLRREQVGGRPTFVMDFAPRPLKAEKESIQNRILGRMAGRLWVDEVDAEPVRVELHLTESFSLGFLGLLGSLQTCDLKLQRLRLEDGQWVMQRSSLYLSGRKLFSSMRFRTTDESSEFRRD